MSDNWGIGFVMFIALAGMVAAAGYTRTSVEAEIRDKAACNAKGGIYHRSPSLCLKPDAVLK